MDIDNSASLSVTLDLHSSHNVMILLESNLTFTIFSFTISLLTNEDIAILVDPFFNIFTTSNQDVAKRYCVEDISMTYFQKTYFCANTYPSKLHNIALVGMDHENLRNVSFFV